MAINLNKGEIIGKYYYRQNGAVFGPLSKEEITKFITPDTEVRYEGIQWTKARDLVDFHDVWPPAAPKTTIQGGAVKKAVTQNDIKADKVSATASPVKPNKTGGGFGVIPIAATLIVIASSFALYYLWYVPYNQDRNALRMYSYANSLVFRSSSVAGVDYNVIGNVPYGSEILVYNLTEDWAQCKHEGKKGVLSSNFLLNKEEFHLLNGIFADVVARDAIPTTKCRKALLQYLKSRKLMTKIDPTLYNEFYKAQPTGDEWQIIAKNKDIKPNAVAFPRVYNPSSKFSDFACIITNLKTKERRFLLFAFSDTEEPMLIFEQPAPPTGWISSVTKNYFEEGKYTVTYAD
jgi:hypothetical protein